MFSHSVGNIEVPKLPYRYEIYGQNRPQAGVINGKNVDAINNPRLQRILSKLLGYTFTVEYVPGKLNFIADALSRAPVFQPEEEDHQDVLVQTIKAEENDLQLQKLIDAATSCAEYQKVKEAVVSKVNLSDLPDAHPVKQFRQQWNALSCEASLGLLTFHGRIVVPLRSQKNSP